MVSMIILWDHRRICVPLLTETSLCGACFYINYILKKITKNLGYSVVEETIGVLGRWLGTKP